jgi:hypothetical protein
MPRLLVVTGASGVGKTAAVQALESRNVRGVSCFYFDSIGVPSAEVMQQVHGGGEQWQAWATKEWLARLGALPDDVSVAVLDGQTRPSFVFAAAPAAAPRTVDVVLLDCTAGVRTERLVGARQQPKLATARMDQWAAYLRGQADVLSLKIIDTTSLTIEEVAGQLEQIVSPLIETS